MTKPALPTYPLKDVIIRKSTYSGWTVETVPYTATYYTVGQVGPSILAAFDNADDAFEWAKKAMTIPLSK